MCKQFSAQSDVMRVRLLLYVLCATANGLFVPRRSLSSGVFPKHNVNILSFNCCLEAEKSKRPGHSWQMEEKWKINI